MLQRRVLSRGAADASARARPWRCCRGLQNIEQALRNVADPLVRRVPVHSGQHQLAASCHVTARSRCQYALICFTFVYLVHPDGPCRNRHGAACTPSSAARHALTCQAPWASSRPYTAARQTRAQDKVVEQRARVARQGGRAARLARQGRGKKATNAAEAARARATCCERQQVATSRAKKGSAPPSRSVSCASALHLHRDRSTVSAPATANIQHHHSHLPSPPPQPPASHCNGRNASFKRLARRRNQAAAALSLTPLPAATHTQAHARTGLNESGTYASGW